MKPSDPRLRAQLAPARSQLLGIAGTGVAGGLLVIAQAWAVAGLIVAAVSGDEILRWGLVAAGVLFSRAVVAALGDVSAARAAAVVGTILRRRLLLAANERSSDTCTGEVAVLATRGVAAAEPYLTRYLPALVLALIVPPLTVVAIATQDLLSAVIVMATLPLVPVFGALVGLATRDRAEKQWRAMAALSGHFLDVVRGLPTLVAHRRARAQSRQIGEISERYRIASLRTLRIAFASSAILELVATLSVALVAVTVGVRLAGGSLDLRTALIVLLLAPEAYWPLRKVGAEFHAAAEGAATFEKAHTLLTSTALPPGGAARDGAFLDLHQVAVTHSGRTTPAVSDVTGRIPARGVTCITGPSGSGKSTLLAALAGLVPTSAGDITSAGRPLGGPAWQSQVAWLPQQPQFLEGSIGDNLRLARPDATDDQLWGALRRVALEVRMQVLPDGLDSRLGEDGATLSAGERARLALARIVLADRPWMLLDEPTAHLDDLTERVILDTIVDLGRRGAVIVVAHRPALVDLADHRIHLSASAPTRRPQTSTGTLDRPAERRAAGTAVGVRSAASSPSFVPSTVLGALASASGVALTATAGWLIVQASTQPAVLTLLVAIVGVRLFGLARPALRYVERLQAHDAALALLSRRRVEVYDALVPLVPARLGRRRGELLNAIVDDVDSVVDRELRVRMPVRQFAIVAALAALVALTQLPAAGVIVLALCSVAGAGAFLVARAGSARAERTLVELRSELSTSVVETVQLADELLMWQATGAAADRAAWTSSRIGRVSSRAAGWLGLARGLVLVLTGVAMGAVALVANASGGSLSGPMTALLVLLPLALADVALPLAEAGALSVRTSEALARLHRLERTAPAVRDTVATGTPHGHDLRVVQARTRWERGGPLTLPVSLRLEPGDRVAVVGASGSGKSTLAALLLRFLDPTEGEVSLGGCSTREMALDDVRRLTGLVDDHPHVFATTLVENIRLARPAASDAEVDVALRRARLGVWLDELPQGLHTWLGDGHAGVSGGERARIGIARSLLAGQPVLVLDEPAAHLDHATAAELAKEVLSGPRERAVLWITHGDVGLDQVDHVVDLGGHPAFSGLGRSF